MVHIEPLSAEHYDALFAVASDPLIWEQHPAHDRWRPEVFRKLFDSGLESSGALLVRDVATKEVIGSSRYYAWQPAERHVSIGYTFLARRCWGGTYNHEMKRLMLEHAFGFVDTVWFHIGIANIRSRRAIAAGEELLTTAARADGVVLDRGVGVLGLEAGLPRRHGGLLR